MGPPVTMATRSLISVLRGDSRLLSLYANRCQMSSSSVGEGSKRVVYPVKPTTGHNPGTHKYNRETHKLYREAMAFFRSRKKRDIGLCAENKRMVKDLMKLGEKPWVVFYTSDEVISDLSFPSSTKLVGVTPGQIARLSNVDASQGLLAVFDKPSSLPADRKQIPIIAYLHQIKDLGNLGTIIRSAAGAELQSIITSPRSAHPWKPVVFRASAAANYMIPIYEQLEFQDALASLPSFWRVCFVQSSRKQDSDVVSLPYEKVDFRSKPTLVVLGNESFGIPGSFIETARRCRDVVLTHIPIPENLESINVAMAASVVFFEAAKQHRCTESEEQPRYEPTQDGLEVETHADQDKEFMKESRTIIGDLDNLFPSR